MTAAARVADPSVSVGAALRAASRRLADAGMETPDLDARLLVGHALGRDWSGLIRERDRPVSHGDLAEIAALVARREACEPVAYIVGSKEFWGLDFQVDRSVLVPRPDSETLVELTLELVRASDRHCTDQGLSLLDLGTGSGCLLLSLLAELPGARGIGVDRSHAAIEVARQNAARLGMSARCTFVVGDWANGLQGSFDVVVFNPPYIASDDIECLADDVCRYEPRSALDGGVDGLACYRKISRDAARLVKPGGFLICEIGAGQAERVREIVFDGKELMFLYGRQDLAQTVRCLAGQKPD